MALAQTNRSIAFSSPLGNDALVVQHLTVTEHLGRLLNIDLQLTSSEGAPDPTQLLGHDATVRIDRPDGKPRYLNGYVARFTRSLAAGAYPSYQATIVPWLWFLTRSADCRIFQNKSVPDIVKDVFRKAGFSDFEDKLAGSYRTWDYCVQYRETDFNFVSRLLEHEGIYYYFTHDDGSHTLVLADSPSAHDPFPGYGSIRYRPASAGYSGGEEVNHFAVATEVQSGAYALTDFDFTAPRKSLALRSAVDRGHANAAFEVFDYPGDYAAYDDGQSYAKRRVEELSARYATATGHADARGIAVGCRFKLEDAPADLRKEYLVVSTSLHATNDDYHSNGRGGRGGSGEPSFSCSFTAIEAATQYRPPRVTPKPVVQGPQTALVVGKAGEEIWTDEHGRVKLQFHWDRHGKADENSSCWVRVAQVWAGNKWGGQFVPRVGQEVIVEFLEGDPDRPIVTGRVYNGGAMPPYDLPAHATRSTLKSQSTPGGGGFNEVRFEDKAGEEQVFVHAQQDMDVRVKHDRREAVGHDRHLTVANDRRDHVGGNHHAGTDGNRTAKVGGDDDLTVAGDRRSAVAGDDHLSVDSDSNAKVGGTVSVDAGADVYLRAGGDHGWAAGGNVHLRAGGNVVVEAGGMLTLAAGPNFLVLGPDGVSIVGSHVNINSGGAAGQGDGCSPIAPDAPELPEAPAAADDDQAGQTDRAAEPPPPPVPVKFSPSAQSMMDAADRGDPFLGGGIP